MREVTASPVVKAGSNPYSKYTAEIILLYSLVGMQKYEIEWYSCSRLFSKQGYLPLEKEFPGTPAFLWPNTA